MDRARPRPEHPTTMYDWLDPTAIRAWLSLNPHWVAASIALIAFVESFAILGIIVPGVAMLGAASFVAGSGALALPDCLLAAFIGAVCGDGVSFLLGRTFHQDIKRMYPFRANPHWIGKAEGFFREYGTNSVAIGRFIGPIRPVIPLVAGIANMPARKFFLINLLSALGWAPVYVLPGYFLGAAVETRLASPALLLGLALVIIGAASLAAWFRVHYRRYSDLAANTETKHEDT